MDIAPRQVGSLVHWEKLKETIETGDILLCQTDGAFGIVEEVATNAPYTHICVFIRWVDTKRLMVLESAIDKKYKDAYNDKTDGPKLIDANYYIHTYLTQEKGVITYRGLRKYWGSKPLPITAPVQQKLYYLFIQLTDVRVTYERRITDLPNSFLRYRDNSYSDPEFEFCSETVASVWVVLGVYIKRVADKLIPKNFSEQYEDVFDRVHNVRENKVFLTNEVTIIM